MTTKFLNVSTLRPWWFRFLVLFFLGVPALTGWPLNEISEFINQLFPFELIEAGKVADLASWTIYTCLIWLVVISSVGADKFLEYLAASFIIGLTTALLGAAMRKIFPYLAGPLSTEEVSLKMFNLLLVITTVTPYAFLFINSFSVKSLICKLKETKGKRRTIGLHFALFLRVFQHTSEVVLKLMAIWIEEHPQLILPRHRRDWGEKWYSSANICPWFCSAVLAWVYATMVHTFEPIPCMVDEVKKIDQHRSPLDG
ncbi:hypothetical protein [Gimesia maris]|uniref:hypothetical protein n=1 Tax=Gimesia maris TaxID=122 RepID=UPI0032ECBB56